MMTLRLPLMVNPQPEIVAPELPRMVVFDRTRIMPEHEIVPETRITFALSLLTAELSADALVTVVAGAFPPPVVPPFCVAQPTRPVGLRPPPPTPPPPPTGTRRHCWFQPLWSVYWEIRPPFAVDHSHTSSTLPLCRLRKRM